MSLWTRIKRLFRREKKMIAPLPISEREVALIIAEPKLLKTRECQVSFCTDCPDRAWCPMGGYLAVQFWTPVVTGGTTWAIFAIFFTHTIMPVVWTTTLVAGLLVAWRRWITPIRQRRKIISDTTEQVSRTPSLFLGEIRRHLGEFEKWYNRNCVAPLVESRTQLAIDQKVLEELECSKDADSIYAEAHEMVEQLDQEIERRMALMRQLSNRVEITHKAIVQNEDSSKRELEEEKALRERLYREVREELENKHPKLIER